MAIDPGRLAWDERHAGGDFEGRGPNPTLTAAAAGYKPGRALELAAGSGTNAVWLASQGWRTTAVDWSPVGLANGKARADAAGLEVEWLERNLLDWTPPARSFDLVVIVYLHMPAVERNAVYARAAAAVAPGGRMVVVGHDRINATEGVGGPPDPTRLFSAAEVGRELIGADGGLRLERADVVRQVPPPGRGAIDALLVLRRGGATFAERLPALGPRGEGWVAVQFALFFAIWLAGAIGPAWSGTARAIGIGVGLVLGACGGLLLLRGFADLGSNLTVFPRPRDGAGLVQKGAYSLVRHPIYGGLIVGAIGWGLAAASPPALIGALVLAAFFDLKSRREEVWLAAEFAGYGAYRARTRKMIPWVY
jgi:protein-S-isoprenylcysteine O-methyltransferase Ste14